ncbi:MAG TPA: sigma 54-interacting transcriptional regulator, partial [Candidatus Binatia bacterium]|nr:sigma 54-interacting transcriptional regulator [Candidatus Binatia bacterium]
APEAGRDFDFDHRLLMPDGAVKHVRVAARAVKNEAGQIIEFIGALMDVTAQKQTQLALEKALQEAQAAKDQFRLAVDSSPALVWTALPDGSRDFHNQRWLEFTGLSFDEGLGWGWKRAFHPDDLITFAKHWGEAVRLSQLLEVEIRLRSAGGEYRWFLARARPLRDEHENVVKWYGTTTDIHERKWAETLLAGENRLLELIAKGDSFASILRELCLLVEKISNDSLASILLLEPASQCLWHGAAPSLPASYIEAIDGSPIGPAAGSCGTAAFRGEPVVVGDIATDALWADYRELALEHGLRACWSTPILSCDKKILGTFAIYWSTPGFPTAQHQKLMDQITHLAAVAIEQERAAEKLRQSEAELRQIVDVVPQHIFVLAPDGSRLYANQVAREYHGLTPADPQEERPATFVHPEDRERVLTERQSAISHGVPYELEARLRDKDGQYRWFLIRGNPLRDQQGTIRRWYGTRTDIEDRKRAEEKLRQEERDLRRIVDAIPQAISVLAPHGTMLYANEVLLEYSGLSLDDVRADVFRSKLFHPEDLARFGNERERVLALGEPFDTEVRLRRHDGQFRWFLVRYKPLRDDTGLVLRWYVTGVDIEDRKQAEARVKKENLALREEIDHSSMFEEIVGSSEALRKVLAQVAKVAGVDSTVLILGETGTGKELIARAIHKRSKRAARAFIRVNCAAIPQTLIASELFGHEKGAFTGALQRRLGRFELADGGTIFLDEVGELPAETQTALLRVLQEREFERVGSSQPIAVDVRVLAATNRNLKAAVAAGSFRQDLFYRLNVFPIQIPSLRERKDDIPLLVEYLIERYAKQAGKKIRNIRKETLALFQAYGWPGNIRELQNVIERAVVLCDSETFSVDETWLRREGQLLSGPSKPFVATLAEREKELIEAVLAECRGQVAGQSGAAARLGIPRQTLESKIKNLGIDKHRFKSRHPM